MPWLIFIKFMCHNWPWIIYVLTSDRHTYVMWRRSARLVSIGLLWFWFNFFVSWDYFIVQSSMKKQPKAKKQLEWIQEVQKGSQSLMTWSVFCSKIWGERCWSVLLILNIGGIVDHHCLYYLFIIQRITLRVIFFLRTTK
jgi:hypothetical protein